MACRSSRWFWSNRSRIENVLRFEMPRPMSDILTMKTARIPSALALGVLAVLLVEPAQAGSRYRYVQYRVPPRHAPPAGNQSNQTNRAKPAAPEEKPVKFKELPLKTEFYFLVDKDRKLFPRIKISDTSARTVLAALPTATALSSRSTRRDLLTTLRLAPLAWRGGPECDGERPERMTYKV